MKMEERSKLATEGLVVAAVEVDRRAAPRQGGGKSGAQVAADEPSKVARMRGLVKLTSRALWLDGDRLIPKLHAVNPPPPIPLPPYTAPCPFVHTDSLSNGTSLISHTSLTPASMHEWRHRVTVSTKQILNPTPKQARHVLIRNKCLYLNLEKHLANNLCTFCSTFRSPD